MMKSFRLEHTSYEFLIYTRLVQKLISIISVQVSYSKINFGLAPLLSESAVARGKSMVDIISFIVKGRYIMYHCPYPSAYFTVIYLMVHRLSGVSTVSLSLPETLLEVSCSRRRSVIHFASSMVVRRYIM